MQPPVSLDFDELFIDGIRAPGTFLGDTFVYHGVTFNVGGGLITREINANYPGDVSSAPAFIRSNTQGGGFMAITMGSMTQVEQLFVSPSAMSGASDPPLTPPQTITITGSFQGVTVPGCSMSLYYSVEAGQEVNYPPGTCIVDRLALDNSGNPGNIVGLDTLVLCAASLPTTLMQSP